MASKTFALRTDPHEAVVGPHTFLFPPEMDSGEFLEAYAGLKETQKAVGGTGKKADGMDVEKAKAASQGLRVFLARLMLPESAEAFATVKLPDRVLIDMLHWAVELYGGGAKERPTG